MIQFNLNRFRMLAKWSLANDKKYYVKTFLQTLVMFLVAFLIFTLITKTNSGRDGNYGPCCFVALAMLVVVVVMGPAFMFYSMKGKHDKQSLMMLPASNFEKYLMRYSTWIILLPLYMVAFFAADLLQYVIHWVLGHSYGAFVTSIVADLVSDALNAKDVVSNHRLLSSLIITFVWFHSMYALGATFFRSHKFNWVLSTGVIILMGVLTIWLTKEGSPLQLSSKATNESYMVGSVIYIGWTLLNFWLSYRLFCRTQVIGKYVNL